MTGSMWLQHVCWFSKDRQYKHSICSLAILAAISTSPVQATTITFDEPSINVADRVSVFVPRIGDMVFDGAHEFHPLSGKSWFEHGINVIDASNLYGHIDLAVSGRNAAQFADITVFMHLDSGGTFDFNSAFFGSTHGWDSANGNTHFLLRGYRDGELMYSTQVNSPQTPRLFIADWKGIDVLALQSGHYLNGANVVDDLSYTVTPSPVPLPPAYTMFLAGLGLIGAFMRSSTRIG